VLQRFCTVQDSVNVEALAILRGGASMDVIAPRLLDGDHYGTAAALYADHLVRQSGR
jgi:hypothetical protein